MGSYYFEFPLLIVLPVIFFLCERLCREQKNSFFFPHLNSFAQQSIAKSKLLYLLKWLTILVLTIALMSPVKDSEIETVPDKGYDIALILDTSESMAARGFNPINIQDTRFDVVQNIVRDFVKSRINDNLGVVVFGKFSFIASPLTYDQKILATIIEQLSIGMAGRYTALYEAIGQGVNLLKSAKAKNKIMILLTDGDNTAGEMSLDTAIALAKKEGIKVYTIGIGGRNEYNSAVLNKIAKETDGVAFAARSAEQLEEVYKKIDELEKSEIEHEKFKFKEYFYIYPLFVALFSLLGFIYFRNMRS